MNASWTLLFGKLVRDFECSTLYPYSHFSGIILSPTTLIEFMTFLTSSYHSHAIEFAEFRDFLLLLPRKISTAEIYQYYEMKRYLGDDGKGVARVTMEGAFLTPRNRLCLTILQEMSASVLKIDRQNPSETLILTFRASRKRMRSISTATFMRKKKSRLAGWRAILPSNFF